MNTDYRYQLESKRLTGHQPRLLRAPASPEGTSCPACSELLPRLKAHPAPPAPCGRPGKCFRTGREEGHDRRARQDVLRADVHLEVPVGSAGAGTLRAFGPNEK